MRSGWLGSECPSRTIIDDMAPLGHNRNVRVIYYYHSTDKPIYLLEIFGKNEKANLTAAERNALAKVVAEIKQRLQRRKA